MRSIIFRNRYTLLLSCLGVYILVLVTEGLITGREPELLKFDNSLFELNLIELQELAESFE